MLVGRLLISYYLQRFRNLLCSCLFALSCVCFLMLSSCVVVHQIDRDKLAKRYMEFDPDPKLSSFKHEVRYIREGAAGGAGQSAGGGCGCN